MATRLMWTVKDDGRRPGERQTETLRIIFTVAGLIVLLVCAVGLTSLRMTLGAKRRVLAAYEVVALETEQMRTASELRARKLRMTALLDRPADASGFLEARQDFQRGLSVLANGAAERQLASDVERLQHLDARLSAAENEVLELVRAGKERASVEDEFFKLVLPIREDFDAALLALGADIRQVVERARQDSERTDGLASNLLYGTVAFALAGVVLLALLLRRNVRALSQIRGRLHEATIFQQRLMGMVGHDLRSPLSTILMSTNLMPGPDGDRSGFEKHRDRINRNAQRMDRMIGLLMDTTRVQAGLGIPVSPRPGDVHELVGHVVDEVRTTNKTRVVEHRHVGDGSGEFDEDRLAQIVTNLLNNALKFSPSGSPVHVVTASTRSALEIEVHNVGQIAPDVLPRIFDPFTKAEPDSSRFSVGLGLYVARQLAEAHGGSVEVRSTEERGTTFHVRLPRHPSRLGERPMAHGELAALH